MGRRPAVSRRSLGAHPGSILADEPVVSACKAHHVDSFFSELAQVLRAPVVLLGVRIARLVERLARDPCRTTAPCEVLGQNLPVRELDFVS